MEGAGRLKIRREQERKIRREQKGKRGEQGELTKIRRELGVRTLRREAQL